MKLSNTYKLNAKEIAHAFMVNDSYHQNSIIKKCDVDATLNGEKYLELNIKIPMEVAEEMVEEFVMNEYGDDGNVFAVAFILNAKKKLEATVVGKNEIEEDD